MAETADHLRQTIRFFEEKLAEHGATPRGMDFNSEAAVHARYRQVLRALQSDRDFSLNDFGCGYGALADYMTANGFTDFRYTGYDITRAMIEAARVKFAAAPHRFVEGGQEGLQPADYTVASGVFNMKQNASTEVWAQYVRDCLAAMYDASTNAMSATFLTSYSDADRMRDDLYYPDPAEIFAFGKTLSRNVAVLHDYELYDFTLVVRRVPFR
jgi:SAM-dependent methyltransferase